MKKCPFCAEEIQDEAIKCRYCQEYLDKPPKKKGRWYQSDSSVLAGFFLLGPLVLPLIWMNPRYSRIMKITLTVVILAVTWWTILYAKHLMSRLDAEMSPLTNMMKGIY